MGQISRQELNQEVNNELDKITVLTEDLGDKTALNTVDKTKVVNAINEVNTNLTTLYGEVTAHSADTVSDGVHGMGSVASKDYEVGTFTLTYSPATGSFSSIGYSAQSGRYLKVGNIVHISGIISTSNFTLGSATGVLVIGGFPFTMKNGWYGSATISRVNRFNFVSLPYEIRGIPYSTNAIQLLTDSPNDIGNVAVQVTSLKEGASAYQNQFQFSMIYETD